MNPRRDPAARYPIRAVSRLTGIGIDTLRAWERRYAAVTPARDDRGRMYTDGDVARLRLLRGLVESGHAIGRVAGLSDDHLRDLAEPRRGETSAASAVEHVRPAPDRSALIAALHAFDGAGLDRELARLATVLRPLELLRDIVMPALVQIGDDWHRGRATIAHEHLMSSTVRSLLGSFLRLHARSDRPSLLFATPAGDRHEIGTIGAAMLAASSGLGVSYLGPDLPARGILESVRGAGARVLVLGLTTTTARTAMERELRAIVRDLPDHVELWAGGRGAERHAQVISPRGTIFRDYTEYHHALVRLADRMA